MPPKGKTNRSGLARAPNAQNQMKSTTTRESKLKSGIDSHDDLHRKLVAERLQLMEAKEQGLLTEEDEPRLAEIEKSLAKYQSGLAQANEIPSRVANPEDIMSWESSTINQGTTAQDEMQQHATGQDVVQQGATGQDVGGLDTTGQHATSSTPAPETTQANAPGQDMRGLDTTRQHATSSTPAPETTQANAPGQDMRGLDTTRQHATSSTPAPETTHANAPRALLKNPRVREEPQEVRVSTKRLVDDLNMTWDVDMNNSYIEPSLQNVDQEAFGHIVRNSRTSYCVRYGSADAYSARFESSLPSGSRYAETRDVTLGDNRIIEKIVYYHRNNKTAVPINLLKNSRVLVVYWDTKVGIGHGADVSVLAPDYRGRRPPTRCLVYLDPEHYKDKYKGITNVSGYSHETRSMVKIFMDGNDDWQKSISFYNIAVRLENKFEEKHMIGVPNRPGPLSELINERKVASRRSRSRYATAEPAASPTPIKPEISPRRSMPLPEIKLEQNPIRPQPVKSLIERFHADFLEVFGLPEDTKYAELTEHQQLQYPAQFTKWKSVNA